MKAIQSLGGYARSNALTPQERSAAARHAANVRWGKSQPVIPVNPDQKPLVPGMLLMTKDGRVIDNAVVIEQVTSGASLLTDIIYNIETVGGKLVQMDHRDIISKFHLKDQTGFVRQQFYPDFVEQRRAAILKNRPLLKKFPRPTAEDHQASLELGVPVIREPALPEPGGTPIPAAE